ncbi:MAG: sarcosine oxidase subunit gamma family protein [Pelagibacteraceae bacterium]|nr:sarcosine oxidase subunit gamma family protein [Pelagibacteraceae bacterium]
MTAATSLEHIHKKGRFGNYHKKDGKNLLQISEVKNLTIIQLVQYKKSKIQPNAIKVEDLDLPLENPKVTANKETRILWNAPRTWLIISSKKNIIGIIKDKCDHENFAITDISHSRAVIQIKGLQSKEVLKKGCPININEIQVNNCAGTVFNGITVVIDFVNNNPDTFNLLALRSFGETFYHHVTDSALEFGYAGV